MHKTLADLGCSLKRHGTCMSLKWGGYVLPAQAFSAFTNDVIWLIVVSFFFAAVRLCKLSEVLAEQDCSLCYCHNNIASGFLQFGAGPVHLKAERQPQPCFGLNVLSLNLQGFQKTGLGERVANMFVAACGKSTLGLAYGLSVAEALLAPAMPSTTARAGGIFMPIINSLSLASDSKPSAPHGLTLKLNPKLVDRAWDAKHHSAQACRHLHAHHQQPQPGLRQQAQCATQRRRRAEVGMQQTPQPPSCL